MKPDPIEARLKATELAQAGRYREAARILLAAVSITLEDHCRHTFRRPGDKYCRDCAKRFGPPDE